MWIRIILALLLCYASVGAQTPIGFNQYQIDDNTQSITWGTPPANYEDSTGWHPVENDWILNGNNMLTNWRSVLKTTVTQDGISVITITWQGNDYTIIQEPVGIAWVNTATWDWDWIDNDLTWITPNVDSNIVHWPGISPGIDYRVRKNNGSVEHGVFFKPGFLDAAAAIFDQRPDSADISICNIFRYSFSSNIDNPDSVFHRGNKRKLKQIAGRVFALTEQRLRFPGSDTLPQISVERHEKRINGSIYGAEMVDMSRIKQVHAAYPNATIWHNATANWSTPNPNTYLNYYAQSNSYYGSNNIRGMQTAFGVREVSLAFFPGIVDSISGASSIDSALLSMHYVSNALGNKNTRVSRMIADGSWHKTDSLNCTWNNRYDAGAADSITWTAGLADWSSTFTTTNAVTVNLGDTTSGGWGEFVITNIISDIKTAGTDFGLWVDNGDESTVYWDGENDPGGDYPTLYIEYTTDGAPADEYEGQVIMIGGQ